MITIDLAKTDKVFTYYYNAEHDLFGSLDQSMNYDFFKPTHKIVIDDTLYAQDIDKIFTKLFKQWLTSDNHYAIMYVRNKGKE